MRTVKLGMPIARPAGLFAFYTLSCMTFRSASKYARHRLNIDGTLSGPEYNWKDTMVGVGWSTVIFGRALTGRPWLLLIPAAVTTAALLTGVEQAIPVLMRGVKIVKEAKVKDAHETGMSSQNWLQKRWERIALMESRLHSLNQEIAQLSASHRT